ncbi:hypothetical protein Pan44_51470 [Caulifigura coniformis]|uniref:Manganese efflux pump MntP n=1 Tax=Caulifigura coniformis TaxID=2527983 RepID=A0A517SLU2_9PLAN|nr:manganese efflux pump [Caulifigura coniformis]QDT57081.1 hypothetical protein Pan44_51470 [Caulifigura coniformis]
MGSIETGLMAIGVSFDVFALALTVGMSHPKWSPSDIGKAVLAMTLPTTLVLVAAHVAGHQLLVDSTMARCWLAPLALAWIGCAMIVGTTASDDITVSRPMPRDAIPLILMGLAASLDAGAAGLAMGCQGTSMLAGTACLGAATAGLAVTGLWAGITVQQVSPRCAEIVGGTLLVGLAEYCCLG